MWQGLTQDSKACVNPGSQHICKHKFSMAYSSFRGKSHANHSMAQITLLLKVLFIKINPQQLKYNLILAQLGQGWPINFSAFDSPSMPQLHTTGVPLFSSVTVHAPLPVLSLSLGMCLSVCTQFMFLFLSQQSRNRYRCSVANQANRASRQRAALQAHTLPRVHNMQDGGTWAKLATPPLYLPIKFYWITVRPMCTLSSCHRDILSLRANTLTIQQLTETFVNFGCSLST